MARFKLSALTLAMTLSPWVMADNSEEDDLFNISLEDLFNIEVVTASRSAESAGKAPGTIVVIPRQQMVDRGYRHLGDVLRALPGVDYGHAVSSVAHNRITIRGITGNNKFVVLQNGFRISSPTGESLPMLNNFSLYNIKQIEVVYGPASALYGADAFTGVINLITYTDSESVSDNLTVNLGSDSYRNIDLLTGFKWGDNVELIIGAHTHRTDNDDLAAGYPDDYQLGDLVTFGGDTIVSAADRKGPNFGTDSHSFNLQMNVGEDFQFRYSESAFKNSSAVGDTPNHSDYGQDPTWENQLSLFNAAYHFDINENWSSDIQASYSIYEIEPQSKFSNTFVDFGDGYKYGKGTEIELSQQFHYRFSEQTNMIFGYVIEQFDAQPKGADLLKPYDPDRDPDSQGLYYLGSDDTLPVKIFRIKYDSYGAFVQAKTDWNDELSSVVGLRYDDSSTYGATTNPRAGLVYTASSDLTFKLLYGEAFLAPSPLASYEHFGSFAFQRDDGLYQSFFFHIPNPDLAPEEMQTLELNANWRVTENLNINATFYKEKVDNMHGSLISEMPVSDFIAGGDISTTEITANVGEADAQGMDVSFIYQQQLGSGVLQLFGHYSYVDGELSAEGRLSDLPYTARGKAHLGLTYRQDNWFITPKIYRVGKTYAGEIINVGQRTDAFTVVDLYGGIDNVFDKVSLTFRIDNLFNKKHYHANWGDSFVSFGRPQDLRTFEVGISYRF